jgi:hypothetical protein
MNHTHGSDQLREYVSHMRVLGTLFAAATVTASLFAAAGPAQAAPPLPVTNDLVLLSQDTAGGDGYCKHFDVHLVTYSASSDVHHPGLFTGPGFTTVTNITTGKSITYNTSGPGKVTLDPVTVDARGTNLFYTTQANSFAGVPQISYTSGPVHFQLNATGLTRAYAHTGRTTDVCAALS